MSSPEITAAAEPTVQVGTCGLVMPIGPLDGYTAEHWAEVKTILTEAVESVTEPKFAVKLVSEADDIGVIQKRIVQNVYANDILVCDVSGKNPNVMFELGMRLAFDKPVIIVKDDKTDYSFDTGIIEHVGYPRDLRFAKIVEFKKILAAKLLATYRVSSSPDHSPFLKNFGTFHVAHLEQTAVSPESLVLERLDDLRSDIGRLQRRVEVSAMHRPRRPIQEFNNMLRDAVKQFIEKENLSEAAPLIGNEKFYRFAENICEPGRFFNRQSDFRYAVDDALKDNSTSSSLG